MPVMGWKSSAVAKATINPCKICQHGVTMPPNLGFDRWPRRSADGTPTCAHHPVDTGRQHAAWRVRDTAVVVVRTTMSSISCQSSRCPRTKKVVRRSCPTTPEVPARNSRQSSRNRYFLGLRGVFAGVDRGKSAFEQLARRVEEGLEKPPNDKTLAT